MGNNSVTPNPHFDFSVLRRFSPSVLPSQEQEENAPKRGDLHKISLKLVAYVRPKLDYSPVSPVEVTIIHTDRAKLLTTYQTLEVFVSSLRYNRYNHSLIAYTPEKKLEVYLMRGKGSVHRQITLPKHTGLSIPKIACMSANQLAVLFSTERSKVNPGFYIINSTTEEHDFIAYPNKTKTFGYLEATKNSTIVLQGAKKGGASFIVLYSYKTKQWLKELRASMWSSIQKVFPSSASNQFIVLQESLLRTHLVGYYVNDRGRVSKLYEFEIQDVSDVVAIEQMSRNFLLARCTASRFNAPDVERILLINPRREEVYSTSIQEGASSVLGRDWICNLEKNGLNVIKVPSEIYRLNDSLKAPSNENHQDDCGPVSVVCRVL